MTIFLGDRAVREDLGDFDFIEDRGDLERGDLARPGDLDREIEINGVSSDFVDLWPLLLPRGATGNLPD